MVECLPYFRNLSSYSLVGTIPPEISQLPNLTSLYVASPPLNLSISKFREKRKDVWIFSKWRNRWKYYAWSDQARLQPWRLIFVSQLIHMVETSVGLIRVFIMRIPHFLLPVGYGCLTIFLLSIPFGSIRHVRTFILGKISLISIWSRIVSIQIITQVQNDSLTLTYPVDINIWLI